MPDAQQGAVHQVVVDHVARLWEDEKKNADELGLRENLILSAIAVLLSFGAFQMQWFHDQYRTIESVPAGWVLRVLLVSALATFAIAFVGLFGKGWMPVTSRVRHLTRLARLRAAQAVMRLWKLVPEQQRPERRRKLLVSLIVGWAESFSDERRAHEVSRPMPPRRSAHLMDLPAGLLEDPPDDENESRQVVATLVYEAYYDIRRRNAIRADRLGRYQAVFLVGVFLNAGAILVYLFQIY